jgi:hypothetical protein
MFSDSQILLLRLYFPCNKHCTNCIISEAASTCTCCAENLIEAGLVECCPCCQKLNICDSCSYLKLTDRPTILKILLATYLQYGIPVLNEIAASLENLIAANNITNVYSSVLIQTVISRQTAEVLEQKVPELLANGADPDLDFSEANPYSTLLEWIFTIEEFPFSISKLLVDASPEKKIFKTKNNNNHTPLGASIRNVLRTDDPTLRERYWSQINWLIANGADPTVESLNYTGCGIYNIIVDRYILNKNTISQLINKGVSYNIDECIIYNCTHTPDQHILLKDTRFGQIIMQITE